MAGKLNSGMQKRVYLKLSGILLMLLATVTVSTMLFLPRLIDVNSYKAEIIATLQQSLQRQVSFDRGEFSMRFGPSLVFHKVTISERTSSEQFLKAEKLVTHLAVLPLLQKKLVLSSLDVKGAEVTITRSADGVLNIDDLLKPTSGETRLSLKRFRLLQSTIAWHDRKISAEGFSATVRDIALELRGIERGDKGSVSLACRIPALSGAPALIKISGKVSLAKAGRPLAESELALKLDVTDFENNRFWNYFGQYVPFAAIGGRSGISTSFEGTPDNFSARGKLQLAGAKVVWQSVFHSPVNPSSVQLEYDLKRTKSSVAMKSLRFKADGLSVKGSCSILDIGSGDPRIIASATSEPFRLEDFHRFIPYGIIAKDAADYIEQHVTGGLFTLETGTLDGRVSQIIAMEKGSNYNVLHIKGTVEQGVIRYGGGTPLFNSIRGGLELAGKDFILHRMSGSFGSSPFTLEGRITDYPLVTPCQYPFTMTMTPRPPEVAWLAAFVRGQKLQFSGESRLQLAGSGYTSAFNLTGNWDLKQAVYSYPGAVKKSVGMNNTLQFTALLGPEETRIKNLSYTLSQFSCAGNGLFRYGGTPYLAYDIQTNSFQLDDSLPIATLWQEYRPRGNVKARIMSNGNPEDFSTMQYRGALDFSGFSVALSPSLKPLSGINGRVLFKGNSLETTSINARYGDSELTLKGVVRDLQNGELELSLASAKLLLRDVGLAPPQSVSAITRLHGTVLRSGTTTTISDMSGMLMSSNFHVSGEYHEGTPARANLTMTSSRLNIDDLKTLLVTAPYVPEKRGPAVAGKTAPPIELQLQLRAEQGTYGDLPFSRLAASVSRSGGLFTLQQMTSELFGGTVSATGTIDPLQADNRYQLSFSADKINAEKLFTTLGVTREVKGTLQLRGTVAARGNTLDDVKRTAAGNMTLQLDKGELKRFNVLSKIFSILNVSQLLKGHLPDMVSNGMPYSRIRGTFDLKDGVVATKDLFVASDAINMSLIGSADIVKETLDYSIGVQPLQTIDKIVNHIPVVGWILTGKEKDFVTLYFEAKGSWSNPKVSAIPVKSMSKGVLNIFRRVFELPVRLFTDTGEVLLGK